MLTTVETVKKQLNIPLDDTTDDDTIKRMIKATSDAIETYCRRDFSEEFTLPKDYDPDNPDPDKPRLPYDVEDACILWTTYRWNLGGNIGVASERIDGLGQKNYAVQTHGDRMIPAPPAVLALIDPYREMIYS